MAAALAAVGLTWWHLVAASQAGGPASSRLLACGSWISSSGFQRESGSHPRPCLLRPPAQALPGSPGSVQPLPALHTSSKQPGTFLPYIIWPGLSRCTQCGPGVGASRMTAGCLGDTREILPPAAEEDHGPRKGLLAVEGDNPGADAIGTQRRQKSPSPGGPGRLPGGGGLGDG